MKETIKKVLLVAMLFIIVIGLTGCSQVNEEAAEDLSGLTAVNRAETEGYTTYLDASKVCFDYPADWISLGSEEMPMFVTTPGNGTSVNMTKEDVLSSISFSGYVEVAKTKIKQEMTVEGEIAQDEINLNGRKAYKLSYKAIDADSQITMNIVQTVIRIDNTMYVLTVGAVSDYYETEKDTLETILASFRYEG